MRYLSKSNYLSTHNENNLSRVDAETLLFSCFSLRVETNCSHEPWPLIYFMRCKEASYSLFGGSYESSSCKVHSVHCCIIIIIRSWWSEKSFWWKMANYRCCQRMNCNQLQSFIKFIWYGTKKGSTNLFWQDQIRIMND